ncbi:heparinase [Pedobacter sp. BS3]|uniref:heparinase II/III domain-containing protein n=1 Tax=Pedobacter sp. BS3 TaxID=2567937 RepID=UPI0011EE770F|nr:heparinase II/III family protein [Pedobacter sp. BS3]TZF82261.1 heparinase [Pedobacter sp. BS3]
MNKSVWHIVRKAIPVAAFLFAAMSIPASAQKARLNSLPQLHLDKQQLDKLILPVSSWKPYPDITRAEKFEAVPLAVRQAYIHEAEQLLSKKWEPLPASVFLEYVRSGNRSNYEDLSFERRHRLATFVLAELFEHKGRFTDEIINGTWAICEESFWGVPAHLSLQKAGSGLPDVNDPVVDLFAAETAAEMAWVYYLFKPELDKVNPLIAERIHDEVNKRILIPYLNHTDWAYLGFQWQKNPGSLRRVNNWNPWINSNVLAAALILSEGEQRNQVIYKTMQSISNYIAPFPADGGSDEGPGYWDRAAGALLDYLQLLKSGSGGKIDVFGNSLIKKMGAYIYKVYIKDRYFINYSDATPRTDPDPALLYRFGLQTKNDTLTHFAAYIAGKSGYGQSTLTSYFGVLNRVLPALFVLNDLLKTEAKEPLLRDVWFPGIQVMAARSRAGSAEGLYLSAKGGNNDESHNHNDVGNFIVYADGNPVLIDFGPQAYTAQTFSSKRYELWNNQSAYHNLPTINGVMQQAGASFKAENVSYSADSRKAQLALNIAPAYPEGAKVTSWIRTITLHRGKEVTLNEKFRLKEVSQPVIENFLTLLPPDTGKPGVISLTDTLSGKTHRIFYDPKKFSVGTDTMILPKEAIDDKIKIGGWGNVLYRLRLAYMPEKPEDEIQIVIK